MPQTTINAFFGGRPPANPPPTSPLPSITQEGDGDVMQLDSQQETSKEPSQAFTRPQTPGESQSRPGKPAETEPRRFQPTYKSSSTARSGHRKFRPYAAGPSALRNRYKSQSLTPEQHAASMPYRKNRDLASVAKETLDVLPGLLSQLPHVFAYKSRLCRLPNLDPLDPDDSPRYVPPGGAAPRTMVRVVNADTFDAALELPARVAQEDFDALPCNAGAGSQASAASSNAPMIPDYGRVAVLNFASNFVPGGGWLKGARAQEEALCYRSSLCLGLNKQFYPLRQLNGIYTPDVLIIRSSMDDGHELLHPDAVADANDLPIVSAISIAALRRPALRSVHHGDGTTKEVFDRDADRELTKAKMRLTLRIAGANDHGLVVLGALGCGAFRNPPQEIANCWYEVIREPEFTAGRFRELCFAVWDKKHEGNFEIFQKTLDGLQL